MYDEMSPWIESGQRYLTHRGSPYNPSYHPYPSLESEMLTRCHPPQHLHHLRQPRSARFAPPLPSQFPTRFRRQLPATPNHPSSLNIETLPSICITHTSSPQTPHRKDHPPTMFPRVDPSPSHSLAGVNIVPGLVPGSAPQLGVSPSRVSKISVDYRYSSLNLEEHQPDGITFIL